MNKRTPSERAIIYAGVLGNLTLDQINDLLKAEIPDAMELRISSYEMMRNSYFEKMVKGIGFKASDQMNEFGKMIFHPKPIGDL